jgi:hypothetical protein
VIWGERDLERFLAASDTTAFLILRGDSLLYEGYFNGYDHDTTQRFTVGGRGLGPGSTLRQRRLVASSLWQPRRSFYCCRA